MPEDMPDRTPDRMSERMPEDIPDKVLECLPDRMPEDMPDMHPRLDFLYVLRGLGLRIRLTKIADLYRKMGLVPQTL